MNAWLESRKLRVLIPLVWASLFAVASLGCLVAAMTGFAPHFYWRGVFFGSFMGTFASVTGIKGRQQR